MASAAQICGFLLLPERKDVLFAVSLTIGKIRKRGLDAGEIARSLKKEDGTAPDPDTIRRAERMETELSLHLAAQLASIYDDCGEPIRRLFEPLRTPEPTTVEERLARAEKEILAVRRELAGNDEK